MTDRDALLRAVLLNPAEDTPRLALADWLEEHAELRACGRCKGKGWYSFRGAEFGYDTEDCADCGATGRVYPDRDRAAFIRAQVRYDRAEHGPWDRCPDCDRCRARQAAVAAWRRAGPDWVGLPGPAVRQDDAVFQVDFPPAGGKSAFSAAFRRGFVEAVTCPLETWLGRPCGRCDGGGQRAGADRPFEYGPDAREALRCPDCRGTGYTGGVAADLCRTQPVCSVAITDMPIHWSGGNLTCYVGGLGRLPRAYWSRLDGHPTEAVARKALSDVLVEIGREWAGLPPA